MSQKWYYAVDGQQEEGPITSARLKELADSGLLLPTDMIRKDGGEQWVPAGKVKGLFPLTSDVPPVVAAPLPPPMAIPVEEQNPFAFTQRTTATPPPLPTPAKLVKPPPLPTPIPLITPPPLPTPVPASPSVLETVIVEVSPRQRLHDQIAQDFRKLVERVKGNPNVAALIPDLAHVESRVIGASTIADDLRRQAEEIDDRWKRHNELSGQLATLQTRTPTVEKKLLGHVNDFGAAAFTAHKEGYTALEEFDATITSLLDACAETDRELSEMQTRHTQLGMTTGMFAVVKAKAEQAMLWVQIKGKQETLAQNTRRLGEHVLKEGGEAPFRTPANADLLTRVAKARAECIKHQDDLRAVEAVMNVPEFTEIGDFAARRVSIESELAGQEAIRVNGQTYLTQRCRGAIEGKTGGDDVMVPLAKLEAGLASLAALEDEAQKRGLPNWLIYKFDEIEQQHIWTATVLDENPVGFGLRRVKREGADRTFLVITHKNSGGGLKLGPIPGQFGAESEMLRITQGESLKLRVGKRVVALKTAGKTKVQRSKIRVGPIVTDTTTEEQAYSIKPEQLIVLAAVTSPILYRLEGGKDVEGQFNAAVVAPRVKEWVDRMQVQRMIAAHQFIPPSITPSSDPMTGDTVPVGGQPESAGLMSGIMTGLAEDAAKDALKSAIGKAVHGSDASASLTAKSGSPAKDGEDVAENDSDDTTATEDHDDDDGDIMNSDTDDGFDGDVDFDGDIDVDDIDF